MQNTTISFDISSDILSALNEEPEELSGHMRLWTALMLFKNHKLTFGSAAELAGVSRQEFLLELDKQKIDLINYSPTDLSIEMNSLKR